MNQEQIKYICDHYSLGALITKPTRVHGGLLHTMWCLRTNKGIYAVKQLSKDININDNKIIQNYELSEQICARFIQEGIPAVGAVKISGHYLAITGSTGFLVYPWVEAKMLYPDLIRESHVVKIAQILAKMHGLNLDESKITEAQFYTHTEQNIVDLFDKVERFNCPFAAELRKNQKNILAANQLYQKAIPILKTHIVVSHGDLDQKNVLWDMNNNPILIDWESACKINPTYDLINTAFYWSGITSNFDKDLFFKMIEAYQKAGGVMNKEHLVAAIHGSFSWIGWLFYNIERSCVLGESEHKNLGIEQVNQTLGTILRLQMIAPEIIRTIKDRL